MTMALSPHEPVVLGYSVARENLPESLNPLFSDTIDCYRQHHPDLRSVYIIGTMATGEWIAGASDVDTIGIISNASDDSTDAERRKGLLSISSQYPEITFIDSRVVLKDETAPKSDSPTVQSHMLNILKVCGVRLWGESLCLPRATISEAVSIYVQYPETLIRKYRSGNLIEAFRANPNLLVRSCSKAALRALFGVAILRGAPFQISPYRIAEAVQHYVPEVTQIKDIAIALIEDPVAPPEDAMQLADEAIKEFYRLAPDGYQ